MTADEIVKIVEEHITLLQCEVKSYPEDAKVMGLTDSIHYREIDLEHSLRGATTPFIEKKQYEPNQLGEIVIRGRLYVTTAKELRELVRKLWEATL